MSVDVDKSGSAFKKALISSRIPKKFATTSTHEINVYPPLC